MRSSSDVQADATATPFNPLVALQSLLSADVVSIKQRVKAAQQLEEYLRLLTPTPGLLLSYEPYLPLLTDVMVTPLKGGQELQTSVLAMLQTLSAHNPTGFGDWIARNTQLGNEPWLVQWSYALLLQTEKMVPEGKMKPNVALVDQLVKYLQALLMQTDTDQWHTLMLKKLQTHFVDIADVLIGWMMSTGPHSPLRDEILTLLNHFGRLWADNSVFSLQLMNSFADEIVNLCNSWSDHQEGDDDRLSTLVTCFMMVAQCVPDLALSADKDVQSPFVRVLRRVASCPQPEYTLPGVDFELETQQLCFSLGCSILENACKLASANFSSIPDPLLVRAAAIGILDDEIPSRVVKKGGQSKRAKVMECLFHLKCADTVTYTTRLCLQLTQLGGIGALKVLGMRALQRLNGRNGEKGNSYFVFAATCFILVSRNPERLKLAHDDDATHIIAIFDLVTAKLEKQNHRHRPPKLTSRQLCLVLKMTCAFIGAVSQWLVDRSDVVETVNGVSLRNVAMGCQCAANVKVREGCIQVLEAFHFRARTREFAGETFDVFLDLLLDPSPIVQRRVMPGALNEVAHFALLKQEKLHTHRHISQPLHSSFVGADFENILSLFQSRECDEGEWNRVCRSIMNRTASDTAMDNSGVLLGAIRQAAAWCVQNRLRTHFGGPAQSFASIERLLQEYADEVKQGTGWASQNDEAAQASFSPTIKPSHQLSNWLMLEFNPESEEYKAVVFFRTNKVVCDDWLNRIRPFLVEMSKNAENYDLWRYHSHAAMTICYNINPAKIFESPMTHLRISPSALLGCIKLCAKCYAALREWTKLRQLVTRFVGFSKSLMDCDYPIEEIQAIFDCSDTWSNEIGTISSLEAPTEHTNEVKDYRTKRAALALRVWNVVSDTNPGHANAASFSDNVADKLRHDLIPLVLQPSPWNGYAGEKVGKRAEETILRMVGVTKKFPMSTGCNQNEAVMEILRLNPEVYDSVTWGQPFLRCSSWNREDWSADAECLHLTGVARLARKQHNFDFARDLLRDAASLKETSRASAMSLGYEKAKLLETIGVENEGRRLLEMQCETSLEVRGLNHTFSGQESVTVRSILHLAESFTKADNTELLSPAASRFLEGAMGTATSESNEALSAAAISSDLQEESAYKCFQAAIAVSPKSAKAWVHYSHWSRRIGQRSLIRSFCHFLDNGELISQRQDVFHQLCAELAPPDYSRDAVDRLTRLQQACHSKVLRFHALAARGYGKYLTVLFSESGSSIPRQEITMAALRLLGLLTTYGADREVMAALDDVFSNGPVDPWSHVIPQLIARAHHPVPTVSSLVCLILKRLAQYSPHAIVYPVVVDSMEPQDTYSSLQEERGTASNTFAAVLQELQNVSSGQVEGVRLLISELRRISILWDEAWISTLVKLSVDVSRRTSTLEKEANRVEKNASLSAKEKSELAHRKLVAIMKPIYVSIERLWKETCGSIRDQHAVTPHERKFLKEYGGVIEKAMENFRDCCVSESRVNTASMKNPEELWQPFAELLKSLMNATGRRELLPLHEISPAMASTSRQLTLTNMPGVVVGKTAGQVEPITIHRVDASVAVLRTKTKPKSLELIGSDGKTYKYLLKAREDLRLDERIMQYLRVTNEFLRADDAAAARDLSAQSYSVIPLSRNAGLIQMVPDVVPLFQVYTARNDANGRAPPDPGAASSAQQQPPPPTAQFYAKLKQHGISNVAPNNRSQWPASVLKQVYQELVAQRPRNVLQQEILLRSGDLRESWIKSTRLSKSLAVMSVLGYIVGLGDRHLDNILLCVNSGDIVHIDHNVCFDKGLRLKVPEIVPFRLTPMLQDAFGFTGVEGRFRVAFETTLRIVRSDSVREALLTLFEAFVYSPLIDWVAEDRRQGRSGDLKARLEVNVNLSLFLSRAEERRQDTISFGRQYEQNADVISRALNGPEVPFVTLLEQRKELLSLESDEQALPKEVSSLEAELSMQQRAEQAKRAEIESSTARFKEITAKTTSFADECLARHQQIEVWRQKSITFAESDPATQLNAVTTAVDTASFQTVRATLCSVLEQSRSAGRQRQLLDALESKCRSVDADVTRLRFEIEKLVTYLAPYLSYYGYQRKELDAYLDLELKLAGKDVYFKWWNLCTEYLHGLEGKQNQENANTIVTCSAPSEESVAESTRILSHLSELQLDLNSQSDEAREASCIAQADKLLEDVSIALSTMKLSNAQGQRLMKLAGASWVIEVMEQLDDESCASNVGYAFTPELIAPSKFGVVVAVTGACSTLVGLVSTPKGSMKRLRASELLASGRDKAMDGFNDILQEVGSFAAVLQEELYQMFMGDNWTLKRVTKWRNKRWADFFFSQIPDILPSTLANTSIVTPETRARDVTKSVAKLMTVCEEWWTYQWSKSRSNAWAQRVSSIRKRHAGRLRYAAWLATKPAEGEGTSLSRNQLLAFLSSQVPQLNALLTDQVTVEASVLELAQQMDYLASNMGDAPDSANESLHVCVQSCYGKVAGLFDYGRTLADLVQGICVIETSSGEMIPETEKIQLEVDVVGTNVLQSASSATLEMRSLNEELKEMTTYVQELQDKLKLKQGMYNSLASRKRAAENAFHSLCLENKDAVLEIARVLSKNVKEMRLLLKGFDKQKTPSKQSQASAGTVNPGSMRQRQLQTDSLSPERPAANAVAGFSFMENDRLVQILLRSIRSVNHLQLLEASLEKHGELNTEDENRRASGVISMPDDVDIEEEQNGAALVSGNSGVMDVSSDSSSVAITPRSVEEKSQYGLQVLKRIEEKLSGTVTEMADAPLVLTVEQQASWLIDEATKTDNLCVMYEGWTPWI
ncbi:Serine/threonine-protein kinase SMG1 [Phytophthora cactorum]|nr:Serine/threonine-protein kinase SMG1 [Phytophthora cactorum]